MKKGLVFFDVYGAKALLAAHVVDAIHTKAVPIMASRVTRWANSACDKFSVPAGRLGKTK